MGKAIAAVGDYKTRRIDTVVAANAHHSCCLQKRERGTHARQGRGRRFLPTVSQGTSHSGRGKMTQKSRQSHVGSRTQEHPHPPYICGRNVSIRVPIEAHRS